MDNNFRNFRLKLIFLALCILLLLAIKGHIKLGYIPELDNKSIAVAFDYYGAFEKEVEALVSHLEEAYMELDGIKSVLSVSEPGRGYVICLFSDRTDLDEAYVQISDITSHVWADFPDQVNRPVITRSSRDSYPVFISYYPMEKIIDSDRIKNAYEAVPGTGEVQVGGQKKMELMVEFHTGRISGMALPIEAMDRRLQGSNLVRKVAMPGGQTLVLSSRLSSPAEFRQVYVTSDLRLSDVADLDYRETESQSLGHIGGKSALLFFVMKSGEGDTVRLCRQLSKVTSQFGGRQLYSFGNKIEKSFIGSSSILLLLFIFLCLGLWCRTRSFNLVIVSTCRSILALLAAIASVTTAGFKVDMTVMAALSSVIIFSFMNLNDYTGGDMDKSEKWAYKFWQQLGKKSPFFRRLYGDWRAFDKSRVLTAEIPTLKDEDFDNYVKGQRGVIDNLDTIQKGSNDWKIRISANGERNTESHSGKRKLSVRALAGIDNLVKYAIFLDTEVNERHSSSNAEVTFDHKFYALGKTNGATALYKITVEEIYQDVEHPHDKRFHHIRYITKIADNVGSLIGETSSPTASARTMPANFTVADLHALVKKYDKDFRPLSFHERKKNSALTAFTILLTLIIALYVPIRFRNLVLPCCITLASGFFVSAVCRCFVKESSTAKAGLPVWSFSPILLFAIFFFSFSPLSPIVSDLTFSMEYESGTSFPFIRKSALDVEASLLEWNSFSRLTLHIDQGRAAFTVLGGRRREIMSKIAELSDLYPEIFFYIPEKHTRHAVDVTVYGNDVTEIEDNILQLAKYVSKSADNVNIIYNFKSDVTNIVLEIPVKCASSGLYPYDVYKALYYTAAEPVVDKFFAGDVETDIKIRGTGRYRKTLSGLLSVPILSPFGIAGEAGDYITVRKEQAQGRIYHRNRMRVLSFSVTGISRSDLRRIVSTFPFTGNCHGEVL